MPRTRYIKPDFFKDEDLATLPFETRILFAGMWTLADKEGRLEDRPIRIKAELFPYDDIDVDKCLQQLSQPKQSSGKPFINRYITDNQRFIQITNWFKHQKPHHTEADSKIPPYTKETITIIRSVDNASSGLINGYLTVNQPLNNKKVNSNKNKKVFVIPTATEVEEYAKSIGFKLDGQYFIDSYESKGWMIGKNHMKDWKASVRTWKSRDNGKNKTFDPYTETEDPTVEEAMELLK